MPRHAKPKPAPGAISPFAAVLTDYAWNRRRPDEPPHTTSQIAARVGQRRPTVHSWLKGITPEIETVFAVMAELNIPLTRLAEAYHAAGLPFPPITEEEAAANPNITAAISAVPHARTTAVTDSNAGRQ